MKTVLIVLVGVAAVAAGAYVGLELLWPASRIGHKPALAALPPLEPITRTSTVVAPAAIALSAIQAALDSTAPRNLAGSRNGGTPDLPINATIGWSIDRGPLAITGRPEGLTIATPLNGSLRANGTLAAIGNVGGQVGRQLGNVLGSIGGSLGREVGNFAGKTFDQTAAVRGNVTVTARPTILPDWHIAPNLSAQASINDVSLPIAGLRISVASEVKPLVDRSVREQTAFLESRIRNDPSFKQAAQAQWMRLCDSFPLGVSGIGAGAPSLWLEIKPTRAFAAQPRIDAAAVNLLIGVEAQTRVVSNRTKPVCPFPDRIEIVPDLSGGHVTVGIPIDIPFPVVNTLLTAQLVGRTFPEDGSGSVAVTVKEVEMAASGDRLLISLLVNGKQRGSFGFGAEATVNVWGKPVLDKDNQILRLTDVTLDVDSDAAFGLIGTAARAAAPYLAPMLASRAVVDLKPFAADARQKIEAVLTDFQKTQTGLRVDAKVEALRLDAVAFDSKTLRIVAEAEGNLNVAVTSLSLP